MRLRQEFEDVDERHCEPAQRAVPDLGRVAAVGRGPRGALRVVVSVVEQPGRRGGGGGGGVLQGVVVHEAELEGDVIYEMRTWPYTIFSLALVYKGGWHCEIIIHGTGTDPMQMCLWAGTSLCIRRRRSRPCTGRPASLEVTHNMFFIYLVKIDL